MGKTLKRKWFDGCWMAAMSRTADMEALPVVLVIRMLMGHQTLIQY